VVIQDYAESGAELLTSFADDPCPTPLEVSISTSRYHQAGQDTLEEDALFLNLQVWDPGGETLTILDADQPWPDTVTVELGPTSATLIGEIEAERYDCTVTMVCGDLEICEFVGFETIFVDLTWSRLGNAKSESVNLFFEEPIVAHFPRHYLTRAAIVTGTVGVDVDDLELELEIDDIGGLYRLIEYANLILPH
jgi:hypothetical protein